MNGKRMTQVSVFKAFTTALITYALKTRSKQGGGALKVPTPAQPMPAFQVKSHLMKILSRKKGITWHLLEILGGLDLSHYKEPESVK